MSKVEPESFTCPVCGWTLKTPFGKEDLQAHTTLHNEMHHNKSLRMTKADLIDKVAKNTKLTKK